MRNEIKSAGIVLLIVIFFGLITWLSLTVSEWFFFGLFILIVVGYTLYGMYGVVMGILKDKEYE